MEDEKHRCEEALRKSLLNLSALAGIGAMQSLPLDARRHYAAALTLAQALRTPTPLEQALLLRIVGRWRAFTPVLLLDDACDRLGAALRGLEALFMV